MYPNAPQILRSLVRDLAKVSGLLNPEILGSGLTLCEARCLFELGQAKSMSISHLASMLELDLGYVSRVVSSLCKARLVSKCEDGLDRRARVLVLTPEGRSLLGQLETATNRRILDWLDGRPQRTTERLLSSIESTLRTSAPVQVRNYQPGDIGQIIQRHIDIYTKEFGFLPDFEIYLIQAVSKFITAFHRESDLFLIADRDSDILGSCALQVVDSGQARLRFLYLESEARHLGLGKRLVGSAINHAKKFGVRSIVLETASHLAAAKSLYGSFGFVKTGEEDMSFLPEGSVGERLELVLQSG